MMTPFWTELARLVAEANRRREAEAEAAAEPPTDTKPLTRDNDLAP